MREDNPINPLLNYSTLNPFMKDRMKIWWKEIFNNGVLRYTDPKDGKEITLKFSDLPLKGTFDLSACGKTADNLVITTSVDRFFKVRAENENRVVILITPRHVVEEEINSSAKPLSPVLEDWDAGRAQVAIFYKWGNDENTSWYDYLTSVHLSELSSKNLFEYWRSSLGCDVSFADGCDVEECGANSISCLFVNQN